MKAWKKFQYWVAEYLGWEYITKKHYGDSVPDVREKKKDGFVGECKHHKAFAIHTLKKKTDLLYKDDIIIFTKVKGTRYEAHNVLVTVSLTWFNIFLECYKRLSKVDIDNKDVKLVDNKLTIHLRDLEYQTGVIKVSANKMRKVIKLMEELNESINS